MKKMKRFCVVCEEQQNAVGKELEIILDNDDDNNLKIVNNSKVLSVV